MTFIKSSWLNHILSFSKSSSSFLIIIFFKYQFINAAVCINASLASFVQVSYPKTGLRQLQVQYYFLQAPIFLYLHYPSMHLTLSVIIPFFNISMIQINLYYHRFKNIHSSCPPSAASVTERSFPITLMQFDLPLQE